MLRTRIAALAGIAAAIGLLAAGCGRSQTPEFQAVSLSNDALVITVAGAEDDEAPPTLIIVDDEAAAARAATPEILAVEPAESTSEEDTSSPEGASSPVNADDADTDAPADATNGGSQAQQDDTTARGPPARTPSPAPAAAGQAQTAPRSNDVPLVIFETDMGPDIDDALGLAMLHGYVKLGKIELAAVTISRDSEAAARYTDALNTFYGRPNIPIGVNRNSSASYFNDRQNYVRLADNMSYDLPSDKIQDGYKLMRRVLARADAENREVLIIQTGFSGNVSKLLNSGGDSISSKSGIELIRQTVPELSIMAGAFDMDVIEFNIKHDLEPAKNLFAKWPTTVAVSPFELGYNIHYPYWAIQSKLSWDGNHPIRKSYEVNDLGWHHDAPPYYDMRSWDLTSIMHAIEPEQNYFKTSGRGTVSVGGDGRTWFNGGSGNHYLLDRGRQYSWDEKERAINRMIELVSMRP